MQASNLLFVDFILLLEMVDEALGYEPSSPVPETAGDRAVIEGCPLPMLIRLHGISSCFRDFWAQITGAWE
jgi:hypothetical protein